MPIQSLITMGVYFVLMLINVSVSHKGAQNRLKRRQHWALQQALSELEFQKGGVTWSQLKVAMLDVIADDPEDTLAKRVRNRKAHPREDE